jgi:hypothetical protein
MVELGWTPVRSRMSPATATLLGCEGMPGSVIRTNPQQAAAKRWLPNIAVIIVAE